MADALTPATFDTPPTFWNDHESRGCADDATVVATGKTYVRVRADLHVMAELYSDARHYATSAAEYGPELFGLCSSARATVKRLERAFPTIRTDYRTWVAPEPEA